MANTAITTTETARARLLAPEQQRALVTADTWSLGEEEKELIKDLYCRGSSDVELRVFSAMCVRLRLSPLARQICAVWHRDRDSGRRTMTAITTIDGFRLIADRTGLYEGQTHPQWCGDDGRWRDVWLSNKPPAAARCGVMRRGWREPLYAVATYRSYRAQGPLWSTKADVMIHKCAEALALRKAFPHDLSGVYTDDEMQQAGVGGSVEEILRQQEFEARGEPEPAPQPATNHRPAKEVRRAIRGASNLVELNRAGELAKGVHPDHLDELRALYKQRSAEIIAAQRPQPEPEGEFIDAEFAAAYERAHQEAQRELDIESTERTQDRVPAGMEVEG